MTARSIICLFNAHEVETSALATAIAFAKRFDAHLRIVHVSAVAQSYSGFYGEAVLVGGGWQEAIDRENRKRLSRSRERSEAACQAAGLALDRTGDAPLPRATFVPLENLSNAALLREVSLCDLVMIGAAMGASDFVEYSLTDLVLFSSGRPILFVRPQADGGAAPVTDRPVAIAWNASPEAIRAVLNGRSLWQHASSVHLIATREARREPPTDDQRMVLHYLEAHGAAPSLEIVEHPHETAAHAVLQRTRALGCETLVMGAYGHSVFRERILGGFSETMLEEAEVSLLMAH